MSSTYVEFKQHEFEFLQYTLYELDKELTYLCDEDEHDGCDDIMEKRPENIKKLLKVKSLIINYVLYVMTFLMQSEIEIHG